MNVAENIRKMTCLTATVEDRPGALAELAKGLADANANLVGMWGYPISGSRAEVMCIPAEPEKVKSLATGAGMEIEESAVFVIEGDDRVGALVEPLQKIAGAGINIYAASALAASSQFAAAIWVNSEDVDKVAGLLGV